MGVKKTGQCDDPITGSNALYPGGDNLGNPTTPEDPPNMLDVEQLRARLQRTRQELQEIDAKIAEAEQEAEPPLQRAATATEKAAKRWGLAAAVGLLGIGLWALTRTAGQYAIAGLLAAAAVIVAAVLLTPDPSPPQSGGLPTAVHPGTVTSTTTPTTPSPTTPPTTPPAPPNTPETTTPRATPEPTTVFTSSPVVDAASESVSSPEPAREDRQPADRDDGGEDEQQRGDDGSDEDNGGEDRRDRCLNVPPRPVVDINACLSAVGELTNVGT